MPFGRRTRIVILVAALVGVVVVSLLFFLVPVCETQLAQNSQPVEVCRHMQLTDPPVVVCGLIVILFLGTFFTEVSAFGFTFKRDVEQLKKRQERIEEKVLDTQSTASRAEENTKDLYKNYAPPDNAEHPQLDTIQDLEDWYDELRRRMPSSSERTSKMGDVYSKMRRKLHGVSDFDARARLRSARGGQRLSAYAYLVENPDPALTSELASVVTSEEQAYGAYQGGRALERLIELDPDAFTPEVRARLESRLPHLPGHSDRAVIFNRILRRRRPNT